MRVLMVLIVCAGSLAGLSCAAGPDCAVAPDTRFGPPEAGLDADLATALLFDRRPGLYHASDFAGRSDWPSTVSFYSPSQTIYFSERFVDYQGRGLDESDYTYRRFETVRVGVGYR